MKNLKEKLSEAISSRPHILQFAKDRKFEEAWIIPLNQQRPTPEDIQSYLLKEQFETVMVEYVWNPDDDNNRFVLTLFLDKHCELKDPKQFIEICLNNFYQYMNFSSFIDIFNTQVVGHPYLLEETVESVNLGIFNHWLSVGPVDLWKPGDVYNIGSIMSKINTRPELEKTTLNFQGLFFRFNVKGDLNGPYYGIKTPCCNKVGDEWIVDDKKIDYWMKLMLDV